MSPGDPGPGLPSYKSSHPAGESHFSSSVRLVGKQQSSHHEGFINALKSILTNCPFSLSSSLLWFVCCRLLCVTRRPTLDTAMEGDRSHCFQIINELYIFRYGGYHHRRHYAPVCRTVYDTITEQVSWVKPVWWRGDLTTNYFYKMFQ